MLAWQGALREPVKTSVASPGRRSVSRIAAKLAPGAAWLGSRSCACLPATLSVSAYSQPGDQQHDVLAQVKESSWQLGKQATKQAPTVTLLCREEARAMAGWRGVERLRLDELASCSCSIGRLEGILVLRSPAPGRPGETRALATTSVRLWKCATLAAT